VRTERGPSIVWFTSGTDKTERGGIDYERCSTDLANLAHAREVWRESSGLFGPRPRSIHHDDLFGLFSRKSEYKRFCSRASAKNDTALPTGRKTAILQQIIEEPTSVSVLRHGNAREIDNGVCHAKQRNIL
jgi:hypothetical protein